MSKCVKVKKTNCKSDKDMRKILAQMEKIVDEKLASQKTLAPVLLTVVTSIIAFLFVNNLGNTLGAMQMQLMVFAYALVCFSLLIISLFKESSYTETVKRTTERFRPHKIGSYCYLSDFEFKMKLAIYAGRKLTCVEALTADCLKQKINEYAHKKKYLNLVMRIILAGALLLAIICVLGVLILPKMPQYSGGEI